MLACVAAEEDLAKDSSFDLCPRPGADKSTSVARLMTIWNGSEHDNVPAFGSIESAFF